MMTENLTRMMKRRMKMMRRMLMGSKGLGFWEYQVCGLGRKARKRQMRKEGKGSWGRGKEQEEEGRESRR